MNFKTQKKINLLKGLKSNLSNFNISLISQKYLEIYQNIIFNCDTKSCEEIGLVPLTNDLNSPMIEDGLHFFTKEKNNKVLNEISSHKIVFLTQQADIT